MPHFPLILADDWGKFLVPAGVVVLWVLGALFGGNKNKPESLSQRQRPLPPRVPPIGSPSLTRLQQQVAQQVRQAQADLAARTPRVAQPIPPRRTPGLPARRAIPTIAPARPAMVAPVRIPQAASPIPRTADRVTPLVATQPDVLPELIELTAASDARELARSLSRGRVRQQIVLSELLQPPLSLRE